MAKSGDNERGHLKSFFSSNQCYICNAPHPCILSWQRYLKYIKISFGLCYFTYITETPTPLVRGCVTVPHLMWISHFLGWK